MQVRSLILAALCAVAVTAVGAVPAFAGEITGNDKSLKNEDGSLNGNSICAFSGQNDTYSGDPDVPDEDGFTRTQAWGQIPHEVRQDFIPPSSEDHPGNSCNGHTGFLSGGGSE
jgi:hypothetical protein